MILIVTTMILIMICIVITVILIMIFIVITMILIMMMTRRRMLGNSAVAVRGRKQWQKSEFI